MIYSADFETTTDINDCRVWAYGLYEIYKETFEYGIDINQMMERLNNGENHTLYFHNLKFDGEFVISWLFKHGFNYVKDRKDLDTNTFTTLISNMGQFYSIEICFHKKGRVKFGVKLYDSLKILPMSVDAIAKSFGLPLSKLSIDYHLKRDIGYVLNEQEQEYLKNDCKIVGMALKTLFEQNMTHMTTGSNALFDAKQRIGKKWNIWFPSPAYEMDQDIRKSYKGGYVYANPKYQGKDVSKGVVLDVNSLYPYVMYYCKLPFGQGLFFKGKYKPDKLYDLYVQRLECQFELREGYLPTIQLKKNLGFVPTEYIRSSNGETVDLCLTSVDLKLFLEHYEVNNLTYINGWMFKSSDTMFRDYIDYWINVKNQATIEGNKGMRTLAKLMLNSLYGKLALKPDVQSKHPYMVDDIVKYALGEVEQRKPIYIPAGTFITAWARDKTIRAAQQCYDRFLYADTDSLHLLGTEMPVGLEIDPVKLGAWKHEGSFTRGRYVRAKTYIERMKDYKNRIYEYEDGIKKKRKRFHVELKVIMFHVKHKGNSLNSQRMKDQLIKNKITCAGLPDRCYSQVTWNNFREGTIYEGKLMFKHVRNGIVLVDTNYSIKKGK